MASVTSLDSRALLEIEIDGRRHSFPAGTTILQAIQKLGGSVPHLCHDDRLKPAGACRTCLVQVSGKSYPVTACNTLAEDGMVIETRTPSVEQLRRTNLSLAVRHYPTSAMTAEPDHPFHQLLAHYDVSPGGVSGPPVFADETHPYLKLSMDRCIHCYRCVRICQEVQGADVWQVWGRGPETQIAPRGQQSLLDAGCVSCGACSDTCPTGAIADRREQPAETWTASTCVYCGVGCQVNVGTANGRVVAVRPAMADVNRGHLCVKGRYAWDFNHADDRVTSPMIRVDGQWRRVTWDEVLDYIAARLGEILARSDGGPRSVGIVGSARATNEENYLTQKFARVVLGTNNVDCCARVCHQPTAAAMKAMLGTGAATNSFDDIEQAATILVSGANPTENHPVVGARIVQAVRRGARLIVIDPRRTELAQMADWHLAVRPGSNIPLLNAMARAIIDEELVDRPFIADRVEGWDEYVQSLAPYAPESVADACGVSADSIRQAARLYATGKPSMCIHGLGMTEHLQGTEGVMALVNLALLTGNIGRPGTGINPLRGQNNVQGSAHMGCEPKSLTGGQSIEAARETVEKVWGVSLPNESGLTLLEMMDAATAGKLKALWCVGYDVYLTLAHEAATAQGLSQLELVVVQDLFMNETARRFGNVFLPAASVFEKDGTFMNSDRRVQRIRAVLPPSGESRTDAWILSEVARRMGHGRHFAHPNVQSVWDEVRAVWPGGAGLEYSRLELNPPQWPCPDPSHPGTPVLHGSRFAHAQRTALKPLPWVPSPETVSAEYPFRLTTGRHLYQFNAGTMTQRTANVQLQAEDVLEISADDAGRLEIAEGQWLNVESRYGSIRLRARLSERVRPGELFTTFHDPTLFVNRVTSPVRDRVVQAPEYKLTAVKIEKA